MGSIRLGFWHREQDWEAPNSIRPLTTAIGERSKLAAIYGGVEATATRRKIAQREKGKKRVSACSRSTPKTWGSSYRDGGMAE